jgi:hypothetical protein
MSLGRGWMMINYIILLIGGVMRTLMGIVALVGIMILGCTDLGQRLAQPPR